MESLKLADVSGLAAGRFCYLSEGFVRKLVGVSVSAARLECSSGTRIRMGGYRPKAAGRHPIRIAVIWARRYACGLRATWIKSSCYAVGCSFPCRVNLRCAQLAFLNNNLLAVLSSVPILCSRTVALKQSWTSNLPSTSVVVTSR